ncbi:cellulase family glycosylhydrolase [Streptomyces sp. ISL-36]|uniref:cellulase family glycosylhydrolase n=1 Tax=Streptomyces sp. ISL-36 TaxID=2819182 RepID=UPI001BE566BA|nr:cellulase family glycosylhydrolase [Streptomyces sp. ISL-36]MBT2439599.1 cellulase family glycosylhydrolase [Streptomyces sp. ISL-36]
MNRKLATAAGALLAVAATLLTAPAAPAAALAAHAADATGTTGTGFHVAGGRLLDANGEDFVFRGVNHAHAWYPTRTGRALADIKALGANSARIVLSTGDRWTKNDAAGVAGVVSQCKANKLVCVLEAHDTTGYGEQSGAVSLSEAADYWLEVANAVKGQEKYVVINLGNEPHGNTGYTAWTQDTTNAISRLRAAGFAHTLMVDAPNWGQDWSHTMRDNAPAVLAADPDRNTVFSLHMYGVYDTAAEVQDYLNSFVSRRLPIVVGEFGNDHSDGNPDEDAIMATARQLNLGYLGWSWSGNGGGVEYLDLATDFDMSRLTPWGRRLFDGVDGIRQTSREASVYGGTGGGGDTQAPTAPGAPTVSEVTATGARLTWPAATDDTGVTGYDVVRVDGSAQTPVTTTTGTSAMLTGLTPATAYTFAVYARDAAGNRSPRSAVAAVTTPDGPSAGSCTVDYRLQDWGSGFNAHVTLHNTGTRAIKGWRLDFAFPGGQTVNSAWNAKVVQQGNHVTATHESWTETLPAGGTVSFGLSASSTGGNGVPATFSLNGTTCAKG